MSTTEGLWSTKLFKIKGGMWETIVGPKKIFGNGWNLEKINYAKVGVSRGERGGEIGWNFPQRKIVKFT